MPRHASPTIVRTPPGSRWVAVSGVGVVLSSLLVVAGLASGAGAAAAATPSVDLHTASSYAVLAGTTVTNTGTSVVNGDLGGSPGTAVDGSPAVTGETHTADAPALQARNDLTTAYNYAAGQPHTTLDSAELGGQTFLAGVYYRGFLGLTGTVTLDGQNDPASVFIFQMDSTLTTASDSKVALVNGAQPCNVFWQVGSSATLGTRTIFVGSVLAQASITLTTGATVQGRALAHDGAVTLDTNTITRPFCTDTTTTSSAATSTTTAAATSTTTAAATSTTTAAATSTTAAAATSTTAAAATTTNPTTAPTTTVAAPAGGAGGPGTGSGAGTAAPAGGAGGPAGAGSGPGAGNFPGAADAAGAGSAGVLGARASRDSVPNGAAGAAGNGAAVLDSTGSGAAAGGSSGVEGARTARAVVPAGHPETGVGGAAPRASNLLLELGSVMLVLSVAGMGLALLRRRQGLAGQVWAGAHRVRL
jgi:hypothetical protein